MLLLLLRTLAVSVRTYVSQRWSELTCIFFIALHGWLTGRVCGWLHGRSSHSFTALQHMPVHTAPRYRSTYGTSATASTRYLLAPCNPFGADKRVLSWNRMYATVYGWRHLVKATEVTAGLAESNGSLSPPRLWRASLHVTCGLTVSTPGSTPGPTLGNEYGKTLLFYPFDYRPRWPWTRSNQ